MRLLLVEDDDLLRESLRRDLRAAGYAVDACADGVEAAHLGEVEPYEMVVLDLGLPRVDGLEVWSGPWPRAQDHNPCDLRLWHRLIAAGHMLTALAGCGVNNIPTKDQTVKAAWANVQGTYQRRNDLIPNLVATVQGYAAQEKSVLNEGSLLRDRRVDSTGLPEQIP